MRSRLSRAPDYLEPVTGWRGRLVVADEQRTRLSSLIYPTVWPPRHELQATCRHRPLVLLRPWRRRPPDHDAPSERCRCGIHATADPEKAVGYLEDCLVQSEPLRWPVLHRIIGRVSLWGSIVECEDGWRASRAYPERLYVPALGEELNNGYDTGGIAHDLTAYGVPVELLECWTRADVAAALKSSPAARPPNDTSAAA
jgi:hypothetical protein